MKVKSVACRAQLGAALLEAWTDRERQVEVDRKERLVEEHHRLVSEIVESVFFRPQRRGLSQQISVTAMSVFRQARVMIVATSSR
jgi:hypothetical protein